MSSIDEIRQQKQLSLSRYRRFKLGAQKREKTPKLEKLGKKNRRKSQKKKKAALSRVDELHKRPKTAPAGTPPRWPGLNRTYNYSTGWQPDFVRDIDDDKTTELLNDTTNLLKKLGLSPEATTLPTLRNTT